jgi:hypothetical protein
LGANQAAAGNHGHIDPVITGQIYCGTSTQTLPAPASNAGKWRYFKAWGGSLVLAASLDGDDRLGIGVIC